LDIKITFSNLRAVNLNLKLNCMKKQFLLIVLFVFVSGFTLLAQTRVITGTITSSVEGEGVIPGVTVTVKGTTIGAITGVDGKYSITVPANATTLVFSYIGMKSKEIEIAGRSVIDGILEADLVGLSEVVVTGVASATSRKTLSITVNKVGEDQLKEVPATSAAGALQGKIAGATIVQASGRPGEAASIRLRGSTALRGSSSPLIIIDGVMVEGTLSDINVDDIASMEVVKGAAASALYGSRAGNGVISIQTKRGSSLAAGESIVTIRNEFGQSQVANKLKVSQHHIYQLQDDYLTEKRYTKYLGVTTYGDLPTHTYADSIGYVVAGGQTLDPNQYMDNPYGVQHDQMALFYKPGNFSTNYASVATNTGKTNFLVAFENTKQSGVVFKSDGFKRQNYRLNVDHQFSKKLKFSTSNLIIKSTTDQGSMDFFSLLQLQPDMNLLANNPNHTAYRLQVDQFGTTINPLYQLANTSNLDTRNRILSSYTFNYTPFTFLTLNAQYSFEKQNNFNSYYRALGYLELSGTLNETRGQLYKSNNNQFSQVAQFTANINKQFGDLVAKMKLSYLYENNKWDDFSTGARDFSVGGIPQFTALDQSTAYNSSGEGEIKAENIFAILDLDYKSKIIGSMLYRRDGASQFGANERYNGYFRFSGAYRLTEDIKIPGIQELKLRAAYGTSGNRPPWYAQYETFNISGGTPVKTNLGNKNLKPSTVTELELAINMEFLNKFEFEFIRAKTDAADQFWPVPLPASSGYQAQWKNMGTLSSWTYEASLGVNVVEKKNLTWKMNIIWDNIKTKITKLNVAPFTTGARGNSGDPGSFYITEGAVFGIFTGERWIRSLAEMQQQITLLSGAGQLYAGKTIADYVLNSDGYVISKGTEGTINETPYKVRSADGNPTALPIGNANAKFHLGFSNTVSFKGITLYALLDWKQGGDIYNLTNQWMYRDNRSVDMDMFGKPDYLKKAVPYFKALYNVATYNSHFVEDGTYVKLRELSLYYAVQPAVLNKVINGFFKEFRFGFIGRNLLTFTNYSGFDPEIGSTEGDGDNTVQAWDEFNYPNFRTISGSIEIKF
jgi:TonB-linked SusC/RagA family outer membrane protein